MKGCCELCSKRARMYCESDSASLCWDCDEKIHSANFLVAKHVRTVLCHNCRSLTPWTASGLNLGRTVSICVGCVASKSREKMDMCKSVELDDGENEGECDTEDDDGEYSEESEEEEEGENQVVPLSLSSSSSPLPPVASSSSSDDLSSRGFELKRRRSEGARFDSEDEMDSIPFNGFGTRKRLNSGASSDNESWRLSRGLKQGDRSSKEVNSKAKDKQNRHEEGATSS